MFPSGYFPSSYFARRYWPDLATPFTAPPMPALTGYIIITIDGVRYAVPAARLDP